MNDSKVITKIGVRAMDATKLKKVQTQPISCQSKEPTRLKASMRLVLLQAQQG
jgi:hypothetical protein